MTTHWQTAAVADSDAPDTNTGPNVATMQHTNSAKDTLNGAKPSKKLLSTSSPEGISVASKITPTRLANLLIRKGPLPIRHITSQLALEVPSFEFLSLSKQRRLIMAAMEQTDTSNNVVFEKVGWGQWAVRKLDSDFIVTEGSEGPNANHSGENDDKVSVNDLKSQSKLGWAKKSGAKRRESITNTKTSLHHVKLPVEPDTNAIASDSEDDDLEMEEEESASEDEEEEEDELFAFDHDDSINKFKRSPPIKFANRVPLKFSPPPACTTDPSNSGPAAFRRRKSSSSAANSNISKIPNNYRHQIFNRSRLDSLENLDNYIMSSSKNSSVSINSPPSQAPQYYSSASAANSVLSAVSPVNSWNGNGNYIHHASSASVTSPESIAVTMNVSSGRRKSSFNESHIRSTLLSSSVPKSNVPQTPTLSAQQLTQPSNSPKIANLLNKTYENEYVANPAVSDSAVSHQYRNQSDTDEEDWATIGAESLRRSQQSKMKSRTPRSPTRSGHPRYRSHSRRSSMNANAGNGTIDINDEERSAAFALVDLRSI